MALMIGELYSAITLAQVPDDRAAARIAAVRGFDRRIGEPRLQGE